MAVVEGCCKPVLEVWWKVFLPRQLGGGYLLLTEPLDRQRNDCRLTASSDGSQTYMMGHRSQHWKLGHKTGNWVTQWCRGCPSLISWGKLFFTSRTIGQAEKRQQAHSVRWWVTDLHDRSQNWKLGHGNGNWVTQWWQWCASLVSVGERLPFTGRTTGQVEKQLQAEGVRWLSTDLQEKPQS